MHRNKRRVVALAVGLIAATGSFGFALAQGPTAAQEPAPVAGAEVRGQTQAALTPEEMLVQADGVKNSGRRISRRVTQLLSDARNSRDVVRVTCLNDKLSQINANAQTVDQRVEAIQRANQIGNSGAMSHEYTVLMVLRTKFETLEQEANACIGQDLFETGPTTVITTIDSDVPDEDPSIAPLPPEGFPAIPPPLSASL